MTAPSTDVGEIVTSTEPPLTPEQMLAEFTRRGDRRGRRAGVCRRAGVDLRPPPRATSPSSRQGARDDRATRRPATSTNRSMLWGRRRPARTGTRFRPTLRRRRSSECAAMRRLRRRDQLRRRARRRPPTSTTGARLSPPIAAWTLDDQPAQRRLQPRPRRPSRHRCAPSAHPRRRSRGVPRRRTAAEPTRRTSWPTLRARSPTSTRASESSAVAGGPCDGVDLGTRTRSGRGCWCAGRRRWGRSSR